MEYVKVESSQIAEVGFGDGLYGPETMGLKFPPNKKQLAAGEPGSECHYGGVSTRTYQALMAAPSIGSYFGQNIKSRPDLYPYTKVEAENPSLPFSTASSTKITSTEGTKSTESTDGETTSPVTSLAVIDTLDNSALFASGGVTDAQLAAGREWYIAHAPKGIETEEKRMELKRFARPLQKLRTGIEARAKEFTGETKRKLAAIDTEKRRLILLVGGIEDEVLKPLTEWEQEEEARKTRLAGIQNELAAKGQRVYMDMAEIEAAINELESFDTSAMQEYKVGIESTIAASLKVLKPELARRKVAEANEKELAELRRKQAERDEQDRINAKAEELAAKKVAEMAAPVSTDTAPAKGFGSPAAVEAKREYGAIDKSHEAAHIEAAEAITEQTGLNPPDAWDVVAAIAKGLIPRVTITY